MKLKSCWSEIALETRSRCLPDRQPSIQLFSRAWWRLSSLCVQLETELQRQVGLKYTTHGPTRPE